VLAQGVLKLLLGWHRLLASSGFWRAQCVACRPFTESAGRAWLVPAPRD
jgi:hypothetical protein